LFNIILILFLSSLFSALLRFNARVRDATFGRLWRSRVITIPRFIILFFVLPVFALIDYLGLAFVYMVPKVVWPLSKPEMTIEDAVNYLAAKTLAPDTGYTNHYVITLRLFNEKSLEFWLAQIPFILFLCIILVIFYRTGWPYRRPALPVSKETATADFKALLK